MIKIIQLARRGRRLPDLKAEALAWWVSRASDRRLHWVMHSRLRGVLTWQIFRTMRQRAHPDPHINAVVEFRITGRGDGGIDRHQLALAGGQCRTSAHGVRKPALTLELEPVAFLRLVTGASSPERLLISGKLKLGGNLLLALALPTALRLPKGRPPRPSSRRQRPGARPCRSD